MGVLLRFRLLRRIVTIGSVLISALLCIVCVPITLVVATIIDLLQRPRSWSWVRRVSLITASLIVEVLGLVAALVLWIVSGFGLARRSRWCWRLHARLMGLYTQTLLWLVKTHIGSEIEVHGDHLLSPGPVVIAARHTSFFDALIPAAIAQRRQHRLIPHHVLARGLVLAPNIDVVGHRFPNEFVQRERRGSATNLDRVREIGAQLQADSCAIIFPEGTFRTDARFDRALARITERDAELAERVAGLEHTLPPRPNGIFALLEGCPAADVVLCLNRGLETFNSVPTALRLVATKQPVVIEFLRFPRSSVPTDRDGFERWLVDRWFEVDRWSAG